MRILIRDTLLLTLAGGVFALIANGLSPRGLALSRDYFSPRFTAVAATPAATTGDAASNTAGATATTRRGLTAASHRQVVAWFLEPGYAEGRSLFIDAREQARYAASHIPGARAFSHYHPDRDVNELMALATVAERIVVYCAGGDCEDSELAALDLIALGIPADKIVVYTGGFAAWTRDGRPVTASR